VVNVIESPTERRDALSRAWSLAEKTLIVSARLMMDARSLGEAQDYSDGCITGRGTFQKFYDQNELRNWIDQTLGALSVPAAPGIFYVFRNEEARTAFMASRYRRRLSAPRPNKSAELFRQHEELLQLLMDFVSERGRLPEPDELFNAAEVCGAFGSIRRAFRVICGVTDKEHWPRNH
jgi:DNA phosphorothioation-associated putative methyltransferase